MNLVPMVESTSPRILVVDDDPFIIELLRDFLSAAGFNLTLLEDPVAGLELAQRGRYDVILLDIMMPRLDGLSFLERIKQIENPPEVIMITARSDAALVTRAMKAGAFDYIVKPISIQRLIMATKNALARRALQTHSGPENPPDEAIGTDFHGFFIAGKKSLELAREARKLANYFAFMMVSGPEGCGKSEWVRAMHAISDRSSGSLEMLDCKTVSRTNVAREVFGYIEGSGGTSTYQPGCLKKADGGILWLKDMETLPEYVQTHLSEYMDSGILLIPGLPEDEFLDSKLIATTRLDFRDENVRNRFSNQFLRRLSILSIHVPALAERREEIVPMAKHLLDVACRKRGRNAPELSSEVETVFQNYPWERNITELIEILDQCLDRCKGDTVSIAHLPSALRDYHSNLSYLLAQDTASRLD